MKDLVIVIVNYNTCADLRNCLRSIPPSAGNLEYQAVVVDNASSDGSASIVRAEFPWVQLVEAGRNGGYAFANNVGLRAMGYGGKTPREMLPRYALLLNPDTVLSKDGLAGMVAFMDAHPDVGVSGPKLVREDGSLDKACRRSFPTPEVSLYRMSGLSKLFPHSKRFGRYNVTYLSVDAESDVDAVVGAFMLMRSEALEQAGLLDEEFFMYGEDLDLCYRIKEHSWRVVYHPEITVLHVKGAASRKASTRAIVAFYDAMNIFHRKHYRARTFFLVNWIIDFGVAFLRSLALLRNRFRPEGRKRVASA